MVLGVSQYAGAEWLERSTKRKLSELGRMVADLLGDVYRGFYHLPHGVCYTPNWEDPMYISVSVLDQLATYDSNLLTRLVVLAHDRLIRVEVQSSNPGRVKLGFSRRSSREGSIFERHPTIEQAVSDLRKEVGE